MAAVSLPNAPTVIRYDRENREIKGYSAASDSPRDRWLAVLEALDDHNDTGGADDGAIAIAAGDYTRDNGEFMRTRRDMTIMAHGVRISGGETIGGGDLENGVLLPGGGSTIYGIHVETAIMALGFKGEAEEYAMDNVTLVNCYLRGDQDCGRGFTYEGTRSLYRFIDCDLHFTHDGFLGGGGDYELVGGRVRQDGSQGLMTFMFRSSVRAYGTEFSAINAGTVTIGPMFQHMAGSENAPFDTLIVGGSITASGGTNSSISVFENTSRTNGPNVYGCPISVNAPITVAIVLLSSTTGAQNAVIDSPIILLQTPVVPPNLLGGTAQAHTVRVGKHRCDVFTVGSTPAGAGAKVLVDGEAGIPLVTADPFHATAGSRPKGYVGRTVLYDDSGTIKMFVCVDAATPTWKEIELTAAP